MIKSILKRIMFVIAYVCPISMFRKIYLRTGSLNAARLMQYKTMIRLSCAEIEDIFTPENRVIRFDKNRNEFTAFNMAYMCDVWGKALFGVSMNCIPVFDFKDREGENFFDTFFQSYVDRGGTTNAYLKKNTLIRNNI